MKRFDLWKLSLLNVFSAPVRSLLTVLGFAIGVAAILAVLTLGEAGKEQVQSEMGRLGIDKVWLTAAAGNGFRHDDGIRLEAATGTKAEVFVYLPVQVKARRGALETVMAVGCEEESAWAFRLCEGRFPSILEWRTTGQTILIGRAAAKKLNVVPGDLVQIGQKTFRVCGIVETREGVSTVSIEEAVILPLDTACTLTNGAIQEIQLNAQPGMSLEYSEKQAAQVLQQWGVEADTMTMKVQMEAASSVINTFVNVLKWVAMVCILVGGIGVMNILLIGVRERKREIGVMKSLGTTPAQICLLFLLEALAYALIGGFLGIVLGFGLVHVAGKSIELAAQPDIQECLCVFSASLVIGLVFGVLPAFRASMLQCADALRQE